MGLSFEKTGFSGCSTESIETGRDALPDDPSMASMSDHLGEADNTERRAFTFDRHVSLSDENGSTSCKLKSRNENAIVLIEMSPVMVGITVYHERGPKEWDSGDISRGSTLTHIQHYPTGKRQKAKNTHELLCHSKRWAKYQASLSIHPKNPFRG